MSKELTPSQHDALEELSRGDLARDREGWHNNGIVAARVIVRVQTIEALERRGLVLIARMAGCCGVASITIAGRAAVLGRA